MNRERGDEYERPDNYRKEERNMEKVIEDKILHVLSIFPIISPSMLQMALGSGITASMWKPVLDRLVEIGSVFRYDKLSTSPGGRTQSVTCISSRPDPNPESEYVD